MSKFLELAHHHATDAAFWLTKKGLVLVVAVSLVGAYSLSRNLGAGPALFHILNSPANRELASQPPAAMVTESINLAAGVLGGLAGWGMLVGWRQLYLRSGRGRRVGVFVDGVGIPHEQLEETMRELRDLAQEGATRQHIVVKFLPRELVAPDERCQRFQRRFGLTSVLWMSVSPSSSTTAAQSISIKLHTVSRDRLALAARTATAQHCAALLALGTLSNSLADALRQRASSLIDVLLFAVAAECLGSNDFDEAAAIFCVIDRRLASKQPPQHNPRLAAREYAVWCLTRSSVYTAKQPPGELALERAIADCERAMALFGQQFPNLHHPQARNYFFAGQLDVALALMQKLDLSQLQEPERVVAELDIAVLQLLRCNWATAAKHFGPIVASPAFATIDIHELIAFADCARDMGYDEAIFLQALYRAIECQAAPPEPFHGDATRWLAEDDSKAALRRIYFHRTQPPKVHVVVGRKVARGKRR